MSQENVKSSKTLHVQFVSDEDVLEHITDKQEGVKLRSSAASQRIVNVKNLIKSGKENVEDETQETWKELDYVEILGSDVQDPQKNGLGLSTGGSEVYSFYTIKRSNKMAQLATEMARTPAKTVTFGTLGDTEEAVSPPASCKRPTANKTPSKGRKNEFISTTPHRLRKRLSGPNLRSDSDSDYSASNSEDDLAEKPSATKTPSKVPQTPGKTPSKKGKKTAANNLVEEYFEAHSSSKVLTSDRTLQRLQTPKLDQETLRKLLETSPPAFAAELKSLHKQYEALFYKWMLQLHLGFNIILYGLGSKRNLLEKFRTSMLKDSLHVVINGFFPSITVKSILNSITEEALDHPGTFRSPLDHMEFIIQKFKQDSSLELYLLIHNLDSQMLRGDKSQQLLGQLASIHNVHLLASIDHINAPLMWDQSKQSQYNWLWYETTTYSSYVEETSYENSLLVKQSGALALSSLTHVLRSLTPNARGIFWLLAEYQLANKDNPTYTGLSFQDFYQQCREAFLVNSDLTLRAQLTEFRDHKLIRTKKGVDGVEYLLIPLDLGTLTDFLEMEDKEA
ncbi:origin recognition complex subunit 2 [Bombina bombina]|uniref:origin recognition complex subunit 2 n=1 Tax=Bombina bombina TaxID=8345 RepID=UPI00235B0B9A|nr:origin recognition complex subunit 2 [Bombina bombina]